jgi:hypothetical protein
MVTAPLTVVATLIWAMVLNGWVERNPSAVGAAAFVMLLIAALVSNALGMPIDNYHVFPNARLGGLADLVISFFLSYGFGLFMSSVIFGGFVVWAWQHMWSS